MWLSIYYSIYIGTYSDIQKICADTPIGDILYALMNIGRFVIF